MSKKSRRRNKRLLALAGLAGAVALSKRKAKADLAGTEDGKGGIDTIDKAKQAMTSDAAYSTKKDTSKSDVAPVVKKASVPVGRMRGAGTDESAIAGQKKRADYATNSRINALNTSEGPPSIDNPYNTRVIKGGRRFKDGGRTGLKSGGKVRGCGIAKRGFGKAMKKGKR